ncbi:MAG TPA: enolase C-terminal domain-like protein [Methylomirabilota bacterium]|nr:enolase C-terminal domain-like protein [Methylomirabilota bacterium]
MADAPRLRVREVLLLERDVRLRLPFRFGVVTLTEATQAFVRARIALEDGREAWGAAAEVLAPKWFDKDPALSNAQNAEQLRQSLRVARALYTEGRPARTAFGLFADSYGPQLAECGARALNPLVASFGPALLDRAVLDALCRLHAVSFYEALRANLPGMAPAELLADFAGFDFAAFLGSLRPADALHARHTVGLVDPITATDQSPGTRLNDGLPETLEEVVAAYGHTYFKLKVGGDVTADVARLAAIAAVLDRLAAPYHVTLDGNEQYESAEAALELWRAMTAAPALRRLVDAILFIEQPVTRKRALAQDVGALGAARPVIIDESDADLDAFVAARARGYRGVSSKSCKGFYKSLINAARCATWNGESTGGRFFMSAEDLTTQPGLALQQDLALVSLLGLGHVERNGHHYVRGLAALPAGEQAAWLAAHPDLYARDGDLVRLRITRGCLAIGSLACPGFAAAAEPAWSDMREGGSAR